MLYAHTIRNAGKEAWQPLSDHLNNVADLAGKFASAFDAELLARTIGLAHDVGKASDAFQRRLEGHSGQVDHSTAGAQLFVGRYGAWGKLLAYTIAGHHGGLPNGIKDGKRRKSLAGRLDSKVEDYAGYEKLVELPDVDDVCHEIPRLLCRESSNEQKTFGATFLIRMLYSCLVDADFLDTESVMDAVRAKARCYEGLTLMQMRDSLHDYMEQLSCDNTPVNHARKDIHVSCVNQAEHKPGIFSLSVPTGGGKTLASLDFALRHAIANGMDRVVYAIPYTSIVEQTAATLKGIFGENSVLEHHCNYEFDEGDEERSLRERLAMENWDHPLVVTTNVQLFESLFSDRPSRCRKNHNLARSVIILDEVQNIPDGYLDPCLAALDELATNYGSSIVLCTATQPSFEGHWLHDIHPCELVPACNRHEELFESRVRYELIGEVTIDDLICRLADQEQSLCIVSTRKAAGILYEELSQTVGKEGVFHLSALMVPAHRSQVFAQIRQRLAEGLTCRVISTQLIEAGVDLDFPLVLREIAGVDSIRQAAGRCNREGRCVLGKTLVFDCPDLAPRGNSWLVKMRGLGKETQAYMRKKKREPFGEEGVDYFFRRRYAESDTDCIGALKCFSNPEKLRSCYFPFEDCGEDFHFIDGSNGALFVPWGDCGRTLLESIRFGSADIQAMRSAQRYTLSIPRWLLEKLEASSAVSTDESLPFMVLELRNGELPFYSDERGLSVMEEDDGFLTI